MLRLRRMLRIAKSWPRDLFFPSLKFVFFSPVTQSPLGPVIKDEVWQFNQLVQHWRKWEGKVRGGKKILKRSYRERMARFSIKGNVLVDEWTGSRARRMVSRPFRRFWRRFFFPLHTIFEDVADPMFLTLNESYQKVFFFFPRRGSSKECY